MAWGVLPNYRLDLLDEFSVFEKHLLPYIASCSRVVACTTNVHSTHCVAMTVHANFLRRIPKNFIVINQLKGGCHKAYWIVYA